MHVPAFVADVAAGTVSGAIVAFIPILWRRPAVAATPGSLVVAGNHGRMIIDQSNHQRWEWSDYSTSTTVNIAGSSSGRPAASSSGDEMAIGALVAGLALIAFLFAWPAALGFLIGSTVVTAVLYGRAAWDPVLRPVRLRSSAAIHIALSVAITIANSSFAYFASADGHGLLHLERELDAQFPGYSSSIPTRWGTLIHHTSDVFTVLGWHGSSMLLSQIAGLVFSAVVTAILALRAAGALGLRRRAAGEHLSQRKTHLAKRLIAEPFGADLAMILVIGSISLVLSSGLAIHLMPAAPQPAHTSPKMSGHSASISSKEVAR